MTCLELLCQQSVALGNGLPGLAHVLLHVHLLPVAPDALRQLLVVLRTHGCSAQIAHITCQFNAEREQFGFSSVWLEERPCQTWLRRLKALETKQMRKPAQPTNSSRHRRTPIGQRGA